jgi:hypothetical protein
VTERGPLDIACDVLHREIAATCPDGSFRFRSWVDSDDPRLRKVVVEPRVPTATTMRFFLHMMGPSTVFADVFVGCYGHVECDDLVELADGTSDPRLSSEARHLIHAAVEGEIEDVYWSDPPCEGRGKTLIGSPGPGQLVGGFGLLRPYRWWRRTTRTYDPYR